jgi:hypothetical protein
MFRVQPRPDEAYDRFIPAIETPRFARGFGKNLLDY